MDFKKSLKDVVVLLVICVVFTGILAVTNSVTAPIIADRLNAAANEAYLVVMPGATGFDDVDLSEHTLPASVTEAKKESSGMGYVIKLEGKGYSTGLVLVVGVSADGKVINVSVVANSETPTKVGTLLTNEGYNLNFKDKNATEAQAVDTVSGVTMTTAAYRSMVVDAINTATILGGGSVDIRTEEEILADNLSAALPAGEGAFTEMFIVEILEGIDKIYSADNGAGYVFVIGKDKDAKYVGVGADGNATGTIVDAMTEEVTEGTDELKATAEAAAAIVSATEMTEITLTTEYKKLFKSCGNNAYAVVTRVQKTATGNYVVDLETDGFGVLGDDHGYIPGSGERIKMRVCISAEGIIINSQTIEHGETDGYGSADLEDGKYNAEFIGKDETGAGEVDIVATHTRTTAAYKYAVLLAFETVTAIEGGATNE